MAVKLENKGYKCDWCNKVYPDPSKADSCRGKHDIVYVPMLKSDVNRLLQFMTTKDEELITETMYKSLIRFLGKVV